VFGWLKDKPGATPTAIGHYTITKRLGAGGMGVVYAARDERLGRHVAIKMIHETASDPRARARLWREARSAARLSHPNVCQVYEVGELKGEPYIVMELLEGESLAERLSQAPLPVAEAARIGLELLGALAALHRHGLLHRDLKPSNVFLTPHGLKLLDFGLVGASRYDALATSIGGESSLTPTGALVGTPRYMSPQQIQGGALDARDDLFAVGAMLYEIVSGQPAFAGETALEVLHAVLYEEPAPLEGASVPPSLDRIVRRALAKKPDARYPSAEAMADDLRSLSGGAETAVKPGEGVVGEGRQALARGSWPEAFEQLSQADGSGEPLDPDALEALGEAAMWTGHHQESIAARQRAYAAHVQAGRPRRAAMVALDLVINHVGRRSHSVAAGWLSRARRLLEGAPEGPEHGHLLATEAYVRLGKGDLDAALERAREVFELGRRFGDQALRALGLTFQGYALVRQGRVPEGFSLLDEAMASASAGELGPLVTRIVYCQTLSACLDLFDYRRAVEWTEAVGRCSAITGGAGFPGDCRTHHAEILIVRGDWARGEEEARTVCAESGPFGPGHTALATYQIGEIRRRSGDLAGAEEAFRRVHELGTAPEPGLALLRLAQGNLEAARSSITAALAEIAAGDRLRRARLLPAQVEIALAAGDTQSARLAAAELAAIAGEYRSSALLAASECASGALALAEGDTAEAARRLRDGCRFWLEAQAPYEAARARFALAEAWRAQGNIASRALELSAAKALFTRLGAVLDAQRAERALNEAEPGSYSAAAE
jgi:tetratricopeptide (TPR) repeat protein